jgi:hypothetical protein
MRKFTIASAKKFIKANQNNLLVKFESTFDGQIDGTSFNRGAQFDTATVDFDDRCASNNHGVIGCWFVGSSRDMLTPFEDNEMIGFNVYNSCGSFSIAIKKEVK